MKTKNLVLILLIMTTIFSSCEKGDKGDTGPAGANGTNGTNGNANVTAQTFTTTSWSNNGSNYYSLFTVFALTSSAQSSGAIQVFSSTDGGTTYRALPFTQYGTISNYLMDFVTQTNLVTVRWVYDGSTLGSDPNTFYGTTLKFKVVVIPPSSRIKHPNLDWKNYEEVKTILEMDN